MANAERPAARLRHVMVLLLVLPMLWAAYAYRLKVEIDAMEGHAQQRLALLSASLDAALLRFESLPVVLAQHPQLKSLLLEPVDGARIDRTNRLLESVNDRTGASVLYLIGPDGNTLAASNWRRPESFVGENYAFRPYFQQAIDGGVGQFFAVGATTRVPGFFIAHPVRDGGRVLGVIVVKIELDPIENTWADGGESVLVVDRHGVVALSSVAAWRFSALAPLEERSREILAQTRQYYTAALAPLPLEWLDERRLGLSGREFLAVARPLPWADWEMLMLNDTAPARGAAWSTVVAVGLVLSVLLVAALYLKLRARRLRERLAEQGVLERTVAERTADLADSNARLTREIAERVGAEQKLRGAQRALIEADRLAALGQMAAGVAHELNQPLAALRTFAGNGLVLLERNRTEALRENLQQMIGLVERMARLTSQLKVFASRRQSAGGQASAWAATQVVAGWLAERLERAGIVLAFLGEDCAFPLQPQALEQVLSNLVGNAADALEGRADGRIQVRTASRDGRVWLAVEDNGPGIDPAVRDRILQPFFSTKPLGHGLGLGLPIVSDLVGGSGGRLEVDAGEGGGTVVRMSWEAAMPQREEVDDE
ncbi:sensor histidine kinase [Thauera sp. SDU_THAU2]|uniref:sensor histidine kinase n=1 Tax=Thauera sp. SDU_THAU2 TaxID=3136633 RepID=UPI00311DB02B